uniref:Uncharacterized protein n=1 Tax=Clytia hemisphaerica TaxID=252671 RepID=A0A7M5WVZ7_9CNID|eukprot:TCONS_00012013-protein
MLNNHTVAAISSSPHATRMRMERNSSMKRSRRISEPLKAPDATKLDVPPRWQSDEVNKSKKVSVYKMDLDEPSISTAGPQNRHRKISRVTSSPVPVQQHRPSSRKISALESIYDLQPGEIDCPCLLHCKRNQSLKDLKRINERNRKKSAYLMANNTSVREMVSVGTQTEPIKKSGFKRFMTSLKN